MGDKAATEVALKIFGAVAGNRKLANAVDKAVDVAEEVAGLRREAALGIVGAVLLWLAPVGVWQATGFKSQYLSLAGCVGALALSDKAVKASRKLPDRLTVLSAAKRAALEKQVRREVALYDPSAVPVAIRSGIEGNLTQVLLHEGFEIDARGVTRGPRTIRIKFRPREGVTLEGLRGVADRVQTALDLDQPPSFLSGPEWYCDLPRPDPEFYPVDRFLIDGFYGPETPITIPLGINIEGELLTARLDDPTVAHWIIGGATGSGKTVFEQVLIRWLMQWHPDLVKLFVVDPKMVSFNSFQYLNQVQTLAEFSGWSRQQIEEIFPDAVEADQFSKRFQRWLPRGVVKTTEAAIEVYGEVLAEMQRRYELCNRLGVETATQYNERARKLGMPIMPRWVVLTDEYFALIAAGDKEKKAVEGHLKSLMALARAVDINILFASQRVSVEVFNMLIRVNATGRVGFMSDENSFKIVMDLMDDPNASELVRKLQGMGHCYVKKGGAKVEEIQSLYWDKASKLPADPGPLRSPAPALEATDAAERPEAASPAVKARQRAEAEAAQLAEQRTQAALELYQAYRAHREAGKAPYKFYELHLGSAHAAKIRAAEIVMEPHLKGWVRELASGEQGLLAPQIVRTVFNLTEKDGAGGKKFRARLAWVEDVLKTSEVTQ